LNDKIFDAVKAKVQQQFGENAKKYVESKTHSKGEDLQLLLEWAAPKESWTVLDIATGGGHVTKLLAPHVKQVFATDITVEMLKEARQFLEQYASNVHFIVADAENLPFLDESFDLVTCRIAAHHFSNADEFIREAYRVLKPGGKLLLVDNVAPEEKVLDEFINKLEWLRDNSHVRCYTKSEWEIWMKQTGFTQRKSHVSRKRLEYQGWVQRTASSSKQISSVTKFMENAEKHVQEYFDFQKEADEITAFKLDEWIVMLEKES